MALAFAPDGARLAVAFDDRAVVFTLATGQAVKFDAHRGAVNTVQFSADGTRLLTGGEDGSAKVWDAQTGSVQRSLEGHSGNVWAAVWSPDGSHIVTSDSDGAVRMWTARDGRLDNRLPGHVDSVYGLVFDPRGDRLATAGADGIAMLWNARWTRYAKGVDVALDLERSQLYRGDTFAALSLDGSLIATVGGARPEVELWDVASGVGRARIRGSRRRQRRRSTSVPTAGASSRAGATGPRSCGAFPMARSRARSPATGISSRGSASTALAPAS